MKTVGFPQIAAVDTSSMDSPETGTAAGTVIYRQHDGSGLKQTLRSHSRVPCVNGFSPF